MQLTALGYTLSCNAGDSLQNVHIPKKQKKIHMNPFYTQLPDRNHHLSKKTSLTR